MESCDCRWATGPHATIGDAVPHLQPCAGHQVYGDWRAKQEREACAKLVDESAAKVRGASNWWGALLDGLAKRIRERGSV
jgi:hypothetical protein